MCLAYPGKIIEIVGDDATVELAENQYKVKLVLLPDAQVGQFVLVHAGYAIQTIDAETAKETWDILHQIEKKL